MESWIWGLTCVFCPIVPSRALALLLRERLEQRRAKTKEADR